ncbi:MAG: 3-oxoacyl-acyl-carrier-protein synthase III [Bacteroidetes bacterium]|nr:MAG: 3-oxoacyl-acyl-carrier-protein synthase III [Bacteroidota bacterium]
MTQHLNTVITGTGSFVPTRVIRNADFTKQVFFEKDHSLVDSPGEEVARKFRDITGIYERRWADDDTNNSDMAAIAAKKAIESANIDPETIDQIIVAHNFGNVKPDSIQTDILPSLASRVKNALRIKNPACIPYDIIFGCPGWIQGMIQAHSFIQSGMAKRCLVIGSETLSRVVDKYDRDIMIFSDGAGAVIVEGIAEEEKRGLLSFSFASHTDEEVGYLYFGKSNSPDHDPNVGYMKMLGRKIYEYSLTQVPLAMKLALDRSGIPIEQLKKIVIHQANEKMDEAIVQRFFRQYHIKINTEEMMPMSIRTLGNSSVATVPTLYDMILKGEIENHQIDSGDVIMFASVGAGMNINAFVYRQ